jgi:hypothetical protein
VVPKTEALRASIKGRWNYPSYYLRSCQFKRGKVGYSVGGALFSLLISNPINRNIKYFLL